MARRKAKAPARRVHLSGQSIVTLDGQDFYLGLHDSPESIARYAALIAVYQNHGLRLPDGFEIESLDPQVAILLGGGSPVAVNPQKAEPGETEIRVITAGYREFAKTKFAESHQEHDRAKQICDALDEHYGDWQVKDFGPLALQEQRARWVKSGCSRGYCNRLTAFVCRIFKWAAAQELADERAYNRLKMVDALREGETEAPETDDVQPVPINHVRRTAAELSPVLKAMLRIHISTGMRPSELCRIRPMDIDRDGAEWIYRPAKHKTKKKGKRRAIPIVGDARDALTDYLNRPADLPCFSPKESMAWHRAKLTANRQTPKSCGNRVGSNRKARPKKQPGDEFTPTSYRQSIQRAAKRAGVPKWHPYQLRHTAGTLVREALGVEAAQALLGHSKAQMTEHYAKLSERAAVEAAKHAPKLDL